MNVLEVLQAATAEMNLPRPPVGTNLATTQNTSYIQLLNFAYSTGRELRQAKCWVQLKKPFSFATVVGQSAYPLPTDFYASIQDTFWNQSTRQSVLPPVSDAAWNTLAYSQVPINGLSAFYRVYGAPNVSNVMQFGISPTPTKVETLSFDYIRRDWIRNTISLTYSEKVTDDTDFFLFDDDLMILGIKARYYQYMGTEWEPYMQDFKARIAQAEARFQGAKRGRMYSFDGRYPVNLPETGFGF